MNLFLAGVGSSLDREAARAALGSLLDDVPFLPGAARGEHDLGTAFCAYAHHGPDQAGEARYVAEEGCRVALWAGRPVRFAAGTEADGRGPLDAASHLAAGAGWAEGLDGRAVVVRLDGRGAEVWTDPLGAYPVFAARAAGGIWISNNPEVLRRLARSEEIDDVALAGLLGGGWPLSGRPLWRGVDRLAPGALHLIRADGGAAREPHTDPALFARMPGGGLDAERAAAILTANVRALADWPGRPSVVPVTGGRDSRAVLAAALAAGIEFEATTGGPPGHPDVEIGRLLCHAAGIEHVPLAGDPHGDMWSDPRAAVRLADLSAAGTACAADGAGFPHGPTEGPLVLWHSGQGGEIARAYYGHRPRLDLDATCEMLFRSFAGRRPGRTGVLSEEGERLVRSEIRSFAEERVALGARVEDVPDLFYLERRMATWAAPTHSCVEWVKDTTSPLWSVRLLPDLLGAPGPGRARAEFHRRVIEILAPALVDVPFADGPGWSERRSPAARRAARAAALARKALAEARRRGAARRGRGRGDGGAGGAPARPADPFEPVVAGVSAALPPAGHGLWRVADRARVERLIEGGAAGLDTMGRYYVWRLAQVLWTPAERALRATRHTGALEERG